ncbi:unnamed protein product [Mytilus edulis]|uniref:ITPR-interacting domain-containing protein n=1 Tax=Mytilus edulis TaxID=6550 RepID=A0A8S3PU80_MYTED|nr:unnamed protein product [Mytilus edulis]
MCSCIVSKKTETSQLEVPVDKKLKWLLGNLEQHSFGSDLSQNTATSNSSDISVDMLLNERSNDPEEILTNLGFGEGEEGNNPNVRIPGRFKADQSGAEGVSITEFLGDNPELSQLLQAISDQQEGGGENLELNTKDMDAMMAAGQGKLSPLYYLTFQALCLLFDSVPLHYIDFKRLAELLEYTEHNLEKSKFVFSSLLTKLESSSPKEKKMDTDKPRSLKKYCKFSKKSKSEKFPIKVRDIPDVLVESNRVTSPTEEIKVQMEGSSSRLQRPNTEDSKVPIKGSSFLQRPNTLQINTEPQMIELASFRSLSSEETPSPTIFRKCKLSSNESLV